MGYFAWKKHVANDHNRILPTRRDKSECGVFTPKMVYSLTLSLEGQGLDPEGTE